MKFDQMVADIMEYESDTFTASGFKLKRKEAVKIAEKLLDRTMNKYVDGVTLDYFLAEIREDN